MSTDITAEWIGACKRIENALFDMRADQVIFRGFMGIVESNPDLPDNNLFVVWAWKNYLFAAVMAVRRLLSKDPRDVSLVNLLDSIGRQPHVLSRERHASLFKGTGFENDAAFINAGFDSAVGEGRDMLDGPDIAGDIKRLRAVAKTLRDYTNKVVAHTDKNADSIRTLPTIRDLDDSMDLMEKIFQKYYFLLNAATVVFPTVAHVPWKKIFLKPWKLDRSNLC